jgi:hypothetical protein
MRKTTFRRAAAAVLVISAVSVACVPSPPEKQLVWSTSFAIDSTATGSSEPYQVGWTPEDTAIECHVFTAAGPYMGMAEPSKPQIATLTATAEPGRSDQVRVHTSWVTTVPAEVVEMRCSAGLRFSVNVIGPRYAVGLHDPGAITFR